ncbi:hypothetical protein KIN20_023920 [Parelaphostrongylus tenuis]|uniref:Uncharacterized protein n=1 Tax=Parelaphostrongylus tenuis TaxID=148309 RepID=A0AAD5QW33_PARTN|nr:hypothetical protein KIN20_023920 [Parelaphostrongylus tenuis]
MSKTVLLLIILISSAQTKLQNMTVQIGEITCGDSDYFDDVLLQVWEKDIMKDDMLGEMRFNVSYPPQNISIFVTEDEILTISPYLIFQHSCTGTCVRSRMNIPSKYLGGIFESWRVDLNSTFDETKPC